MRRLGDWVRRADPPAVKRVVEEGSDVAEEGDEAKGDVGDCWEEDAKGLDSDDIVSRAVGGYKESDCVETDSPKVSVCRVVVVLRCA